MPHRIGPHSEHRPRRGGALLDEGLVKLHSSGTQGYVEQPLHTADDKLASRLRERQQAALSHLHGANRLSPPVNLQKERAQAKQRGDHSDRGGGSHSAVVLPSDRKAASDVQGSSLQMTGKQNLW
jgi:hypothetical protein